LREEKQSINLDKKEYVDPWEVGSDAKLWEWCANREAGIFPFLLRRSNEGGRGDIHKNYQTAGRWADDNIALVGDYDQSEDYDRAKREFSNISKQIKRDFRHFIKH
jgi:hypothetical protein